MGQTISPLRTRDPVWRGLTIFVSSTIGGTLHMNMPLGLEGLR